MLYLSRIIALTLFLTACGGGGSSDAGGPTSQLKTYFTVSTNVGAGGSVSPQTVEVEQGNTASIEITVEQGFVVDTVQGCNGSLSNFTYTTAEVTANCQIAVTFAKLSNISGVAHLGMLSGATVKLLELPEKELIGETATSSQSTHYGEFSFTDIALVEQKYYLIEVSGGQSLDPDMDGITEAQEAIPVNGKFSAIATGLQLTEQVIQVSPLSDLQALYVKLDEGQYRIESGGNLDAVSELIVDDINADNVVNALDVLLFNPSVHQNKLRINYSALVNSYSQNIYEDYGDERKLYDLINLLDTDIVVEGGVFQTTPFIVSASLTQLPEGLSVQWLLDGESIDIAANVEEQDTGATLLTARLSFNGVVITDVSKTITGYQTTTLAEKSIAPDEGGVIALDAEGITGEYTGTKIIIPAGALSQPQNISLNANSTDIIPSTKGAVSPVVTFYPSGLTFEKPATIALPYNSSTTINDLSDIRIARTDEQGNVDYLTPTKLDSDKGLVYFTTTHFSSYVVINKDVEDILTDGYGDPLLKAAIEDINQRFGDEYSHVSEDDWLSYLSTEIANVDNQSALTVYDAYLSASTVEKIKSEIARDGVPSTVLGGPYRGYTAAFKEMFGETVSPEGGVLAEWTFANKMISSPVQTLFEEAEKKYFKHPSLTNAYFDFKSAEGRMVEAQEAVSDVFNDRFPFDVSELNLIDKLLGMYKDSLLSVGGKIVGDFSDIRVNWQIKNYFSLREQGYGASELISALATNTAIDVWSVESGWFSDTSYKPSGTPPAKFWQMVEGLYTSHSSANTSNEQFKTLLDAAIALADIEEPEDFFYLAAYQVDEQEKVFFENRYDQSAIEVTSNKDKSFIVDFSLQMEGDDDYKSNFDPEFSIKPEDGCIICSDKLMGLSYEIVRLRNSIDDEQFIIGIEFTYSGDSQEIDYEFDFSYQSGFTDIFNAGRRLTIKIEPENIAPIADIEAPGGVTFNAGQPIELRAIASDPDGSISTVSWHIFTEHNIDYADNEETLSFIAPDVSGIETLDVLLYVSDDKGKESSESITLTIGPNINVEVTDGAETTQRTFTLDDFGVDVASITWDWGDGSEPVTFSGMTASHDYLQTGTFTVVMLIKTSDGDVFQQTLDVVIGYDVIEPGEIDTIFPDPNLATCVREAVNTNGLINVVDLLTLICENRAISDTSGLEKLNQLTILNLRNNQISEIYLADNQSLTTLFLDKNYFSEVAIEKNVELVYFSASNNKLNSVFLSENNKLERVILNGNEIDFLDVSNNQNLELLSLSYTGLVELDVSQNIALEELYLYSSTLNNINVSNNINLKSLYLSSDYLSSIDLSNNRELQKLDIQSNAYYHAYYDEIINRDYQNSLTELDLSNNTKLIYLNLQGNALSSLDLSSQKDLEIVNLDFNELSYIDLTNNVNLTQLRLQANQLTEINLLNNNYLENLDVSYNLLTSIDLSQNTQLPDGWFNLRGNPLLTIYTGSNDSFGDLSGELLSLPNMPALTAQKITSGLLLTIVHNAGRFINAYQIYRSKDAGELGELINEGLDKEYSDLFLEDGVTYYYTVSACNPRGCISSGQSYIKYEDSAVSKDAPEFVSGVFIEDTTGGFALSWREATGTETHYELYRSTIAGVLGVNIYSGSARSYIDTDVSDGVRYYYTAKACNDSACTQGSQDYKLYEGEVVTTYPNLISEIFVSKTEYTVGESVDFRGMFRNIGNADRPEARLTFYTSSDETITEDDTEIIIGLYNFLLLPDETVSAPGIGIGTPGEYYFGVCVEVLPNESDKTDNCSEAIKITVL